LKGVWGEEVGGDVKRFYAYGHCTSIWSISTIVEAPQDDADALGPLIETYESPLD